MGCNEKAVFQISSAKNLRTIGSHANAQPVVITHDFHCPDCGVTLARRGKDYRHLCSGKQPVQYQINRQAICDECEHSEGNVCLEYKRLHPDRNCKISIGVKMPYAGCPVGKWPKVLMQCPACERAIFDEAGVTRCRYCNWTDPEKLKASSNAGPFHAYGRARFVTLAQLQSDTVKLAAMVPADTTAIVGAARSGLSVATTVAMLLHLPLYIYRQQQGDVIEAGSGWRLGQKEIDLASAKVFVVDDTVMTGASTEAMKIAMDGMFKRTTYGALYVNPLAIHKPDVHVVDLPWPHLLEWNLFNSVLSPSLALDFDGILCEDCLPEQDDDGPRYFDFINSATPKYLPRRVSVPLIVTARLEKYREPTLAWLDRHGIHCDRLVMHPAATLAERVNSDVAYYKARNFSAWASAGTQSPGPPMFVESDARQAKRISVLSHHICICPTTAEVFQ